MDVLTVVKADDLIIVFGGHGCCVIEKGLGAGVTDTWENDGICREDLISAAEYLVKTHGCNCLILGCTELPLILDESDDFEVAGSRVIVVDPTAALARKVVKTAEDAYAATGIR